MADPLIPKLVARPWMPAPFGGLWATSGNRPPANGRASGKVPDPSRRNAPAPAGTPRPGERPAGGGVRPPGPPPRTPSGARPPAVRPGPPPGRPASTGGRSAPSTGRPAPAGAPGPRRPAPSRVPGLTGWLNNFLDSMGLPRYSIARYLVIWVPLLVVILGVILLLIYLNQNTAAPAAALPKFMNVETAKGSFKIQLYSDPADGVQNVVRNFADKAKAGYFDGKIFHRVENFVIQGGDPLGTGSGGGNLPAQYNQKPFVRGSVGVASTQGAGPQINDSQWFVAKVDSPSWTGQYSNFGMVVSGLEVVDKIQIGDKMTKVTVSDQ